MNKKTLKSTGAVLAGFVTVFVLSTVTDMIFEKLGVFPPLDKPSAYTDWMMVIALAYRTIYTVLGGYITAKLSYTKPMRQVRILATIGTVAATLGLVATWGHGLGPEWYPVALAALAYPSVWLGGKLKTGYGRQTLIISIAGLMLISVICIFVMSHQKTNRAQNAAETKKEQNEEKEHAGYEEPPSNKIIKVVEINSGGYSPQTITVKVGTTIAFKNIDKENHFATADTFGTDVFGAFNSGVIKPGQQISVVEYKKRGTYTYHCQLHPDEKGTVIVED